MLAIIVRFELKNETALRAFDALVAETVRTIRQEEPGTLLYVTHKVTDSPLSRVFYEFYRDAEAFTYHESQPHTRRFLLEREQYLDTYRIEVVNPTGGKGWIVGE